MDREIIALFFGAFAMLSILIRMAGIDRYKSKRQRIKRGKKKKRLQVSVSLPFLLITAVIFATMITLVLLSILGVIQTPWVIFWYFILSLMTFAAYGADKSRAINDLWRVPEPALHAYEFAGGWPGALIAQHFFRHKRKKRDYQVVFWTIVIIHMIFWVWWFLG